jgi:predicted kinase
MKQLTMLVGPPGSGKSTYSKNLIHDDGDHGLSTVYVNQDSQRKEHFTIFDQAIFDGKNIVVDRMGFSKSQRARYLDVARSKGYTSKIVVLHESYNTCLERCRKRFGKHETINDEQSARGALNTFFTKYERPAKDEANELVFLYPEGDKPSAVIFDLDGTLCDVSHRRHFVQNIVGQKKDWQSFFRGMVDDAPNLWCAELVESMSKNHVIVYCSGRPDSWRSHTVEWLKKHNLFEFKNDDTNCDFHLYMRPRSDSRDDSLVKEVILDFEILTRFKPFFMVDDRRRVVDMWRSRGFVCLACDEGNF